MNRQKLTHILISLGLSALAAACASTGQGSSAAASPLPRATGADDLSSVCPSTIVLQMNWYPQGEHGGLYRLLGPSPTIDANAKRLSGPLVFDGHDTGVTLEIRAGGPVTGYQPVSALMAADSSITMGVVATDEAVEQAASHPLIAVFAPMDVNPQIIMWSPQVHPAWKSIADIGRSGATVVYGAGAAYMDYLVDSGLLKKSQTDGSYTGSPARFVASGGQIAQQGYVDNEPYIYEHELTEWDRPVAYQLVSDTGYPIYPETVAVRPGDLTRLTPCLKRLVPIFQKSTVEYMRDPTPTNEMIVSAVKQFNPGADYTPAQAAFATQQLKNYGIIKNGADGAVGGFDPTRVQRVIDLLRPILRKSGTTVSPALTASAIVTDEFIDPTVKLPY